MAVRKGSGRPWKAMATVWRKTMTMSSRTTTSSVRCGSVAATATVAAVVDHLGEAMAIAVGYRAPDATRDDIVDNHEGGPVSPS